MSQRVNIDLAGGQPTPVTKRRHNDTRILSVRQMTVEDCADMRQPAKRFQIKHIRDHHHTIARLIASGYNNIEIAEAVGRNQQTISILRNSPAMRELVEHYRNLDTAKWLENRDHYYDDIHAASRMAWAKIRERLEAADDEDSVEVIPVRTLLAIADSGADRVGYHKKSTSINVNVDFAAKLERAIARSRAPIEIASIAGPTQLED